MAETFVSVSGPFTLFHYSYPLARVTAHADARGTIGQRLATSTMIRSSFILDRQNMLGHLTDHLFLNWKKSNKSVLRCGAVVLGSAYLLHSQNGRKFAYSFLSASSSGPCKAARVASQHQKTPPPANANNVNPMAPEDASLPADDQAGRTANRAAPSPMSSPKTTSSQCSLSTNR